MEQLGKLLNGMENTAVMKYRLDPESLTNKLKIASLEAIERAKQSAKKAKAKQLAKAPAAAERIVTKTGKVRKQAVKQNVKRPQIDSKVKALEDEDKAIELLTGRNGI